MLNVSQTSLQQKAVDIRDMDMNINDYEFQSFYDCNYQLDF